ncbi:hypothetical protein [Terrabacter sp. BE26]|uniref:hypothetical protein n=1 Tax=Terrabacter sp. BE26 TaxID=2898152 RepID=UPI0035BE1220
MTFSIRRAALATALAVAALVPAISASPMPAAAASSAPVTGSDISWPECRKGMGIPSRRTEGKPIPASARFLVIGLTNGPGFYPNPCLADQVAWAKAHHVYTAAYAMTTYPSAAQLNANRNAGPYRSKDWRNGLWNTGWAQAQFNIANMRKAGLASPIVWMDVEPYAVAPWSKSQSANTAVFNGAYNAYRAAGYRVGIYSTRYAWHAMLGGARYGVPEWHTTGPTSLGTAQRACNAASIQGGRTVMAQWWTTLTDFDVVCPSSATKAGLATYFHKY